MKRVLSTITVIAVAWSAAGAADAAAVTPTFITNTSAASDATPLRELAEARGLRVGSAVSAKTMDGDAGYRDRVVREFNTVTPENELKWAYVQPTQGQFAFENVETVVKTAEDHGQSVRGHTLVWHSTLPAWLENGDFTTEELRDILKTHIDTVMGKYQGRIHVWDVVNEPLDEVGNLRAGFWLNKLGPSYIADAFRWARAADPNAKLYLNEYGAEQDTRKARGLYNLVKDLKAQGVPIDGVGFQTHRLASTRLSALADMLRRFADLDVDVAITELDVRIPLPVTPEKLNQQANVYGWATAACLAVARCRSITTWGFTDAYSWIPKAYPGWGAATLLDESLNAKPAYDRMQAVLAGWQRPATDPVGWWRLDDWWTAGTSGGTATDASGFARHATVDGAGLGHEGRSPGSTAFRGDGTGAAATTASPVLATDRSYTVSAWVALSHKNGRQVVASQDGVSQNAFWFGYDSTSDRWTFTIPKADTSDPGTQTIVSQTVPATGVWTHLAAVWNAGWGRMLLYVNGKLEAVAPKGSDPPGVSWASHGPFHIGRSATGGFFAGRISDVRAFARTVDATEIAAIADSAVGRYDFDGHTGDGSWFARDGFPNPELVNWTTGRDGRVSGALELTGTDIIDVRKSALFTDRSYTVSAWVQLADKDADGQPDADGDQVVLCQYGATRAAFYLKYQKSTNRWVFTVPTRDAGYTTWQTVQSVNPATAGRWTHVAAVWNAGWGRMLLYVDGKWQGTFPPSTSDPATSWASGESLQIGRSPEGWRLKGALDDVRLYQRVLSDSEIAALAAG